MQFFTDLRCQRSLRILGHAIGDGGLRQTTNRHLVHVRSVSTVNGLSEEIIEVAEFRGRSSCYPSQRNPGLQVGLSVCRHFCTVSYKETRTAVFTRHWKNAKRLLNPSYAADSYKNQNPTNFPLVEDQTYDASVGGSMSNAST